MTVIQRTDSFAVVPAAKIHPLADQLDRRLCSEHLQSRHVEVIDKEDEELAKWRSKHSFTATTDTEQYKYKYSSLKGQNTSSVLPHAPAEYRRYG